jgi:hypothetical protein
MDFTVDILPQEKLLSQASRHTECVPEPVMGRKKRTEFRQTTDHNWDMTRWPLPIPLDLQEVAL